MKDLMFFDANTSIGGSILGGKVSVADLLSSMDRFGVDRALVRHSNCWAVGAVIANRLITNELKQDKDGRLTGVWCILPSQCEELPPPNELFAAMKPAHIGALTLMPADHRYVPCRLTLGKYLDAATERRIPVLLHGFNHNWKEIYDFMKEFPNLYAIINAGCKWGSDRDIRPLLENYPNVCVELASYWVPEGIRDLAEKYGASRILYGSMFPQMNQGNGMLQLKQSGLSEKDIAAIAGLNLQNLLEGSEL